MTFEAFNYDQKRVRAAGTREWKLWFTESGEGLHFRMLTKDSASDCYLTLSGTALVMPGDPPVQETDNGDAIFTAQYRYIDEEGGISLYLDQDDRDLVWTVGFGKYGDDHCAFTTPGPMMPETAG